MNHETLLKELDGVIAFFEEDNALFVQKERTKIRERMDARRCVMETYTYHLSCLKKQIPQEPHLRQHFAQKLKRLDEVMIQNQAHLATTLDAFTTLVDILKKDMFAKKDMPLKRYGQVGKNIHSAHTPFVSVRQAF